MENPLRQISSACDISEEQRDALYHVIEQRRDVRSDFLDIEIEDEKLARVLHAAHCAPSVGFMQPWDFIIIKSQQVREQVKAAFLSANADAAQQFDAKRKEKYRSFKLEGILEAPVNICITCDRTRTKQAVIGRTHIPEMDLYSTVCAVQNLWLAARAENLGVGWVSIFEKDVLKNILHLPDHIEPVAYLCIGYVSHFKPKPEFETAGWLPRLALDTLVKSDSWDGTIDPALQQAIIDNGKP